MDHVGIVVDDLAEATAFFGELGLEAGGDGSVAGPWVERIVALDGVRVDFAFMQTPDGHGRLELIKFNAPPGPGGDRHAPANMPGIRHIAFAVDDIDAVSRPPSGPRRGARRRGRALRKQLPALLHPRPGGDHRRAGGEDRLRHRSLP